MADEKNPDEKPSFFDFADEARSWPPVDGYQTEEAEDTISSGGSFFDKSKANQEAENKEDALDQLMSIETEPSPAPAPTEVDGDYIDLLLNDFSPFRDADMEGQVRVAKQEDFLVPPQNKASQSKPKPQETPEESKALDDIFSPSQSAPSLKPEPVKANLEEDDDEGVFSIDDLIEEQQEARREEVIAADQSLIEASLSKASKVENFASAEQEVRQAQPEPPPLPPPPVDIADELFGGDMPPSDEPEQVLPFRTYSSIDYGEEKIMESAEEEEKTPLQNLLANRNLVILLSVMVLFVGYFVYSKVFNRQYVTTASKRSRRPPPRKQDKVFIAGQKDLLPVWEAATQQGSKYYEELKLVKTIYSGSGRDNPFAMPDSIIADLRRQAELDIIKKQQPHNFKRIAYRATLIGVLTSKDSTVALVNQQEADFDVLEGTGKVKVLKLATKAMERAKQNTQEMVVGSYIGPWVITKIDSPESAFVDAKVHVEHKGITKVLTMGKAVELGIFTTGGQIDNLENPVGTTSLDTTPVEPSFADLDDE